MKIILVITCNVGYNPVGWGVPYSNLVTVDSTQILMETSIQVLLILLDYGYPICTSRMPNNTHITSLKTSSSPSSSSSTPRLDSDDNTLPCIGSAEIDNKGFNIFRRLLSEIRDSSSLSFIYRGFIRLLNSVPDSERSLLPHSINRIQCEQELMALLWKFLEECPAFLPYILKYHLIPSYSLILFL